MRAQEKGEPLPIAHVLVDDDDDVDPFNEREVLWALATRVLDIKP
ncbi:MAG: UbiD family decarboxylase [Desulfobacterales bacterium]|nr:UbiD family decarboxylase [Desulfobacterales bacterium]